MSLSDEQETSFVRTIDSILAASDLNSISEKRIRKGIQSSVNYDITDLKEPIKALIMARFDKSVAEKDTAPQTNGHSHGQSTDASPEPPKGAEPTQEPSPSLSPSSKARKRQHDDDDDDSSEAPKKKRKSAPVDKDAAFAAKLQAEENGRARATRGGVNKKATPAKKKATKKKTAHKVKAEDDSDIEASGSEVAEKKVNRSGGFHKQMTLSAPLSALLDGEVAMSRPQTVKRIWAYVKANDLQDPNDKRMLVCDGPMRAVFKQDKVHMFTMNKILGTHLYPADEE